MIGGRTAAGIFNAGDRANRAANALREAGFEPDDISILSKYTRGREDAVGERGSHADEGAKVGAVAGGALGGLAGWLVGVGALAIPGVGPFLAAGPLAVALGGLVAGGAAGGLVGALTGAGISGEHAEWYARELDRGNWLVTVDADGRAGEARRVLRDFGASFPPGDGHAEALPAGDTGSNGRRSYAGEDTAAPEPGPDDPSGVRVQTPPGVSPAGGPP